MHNISYFALLNFTLGTRKYRGMIQTFKDRGIIAVISGFSGAGKGTIMKQLVSRYDRYRLSVSMTTREPRPGEVDGKEYFFVEEEAFL